MSVFIKHPPRRSIDFVPYEYKVPAALAELLASLTPEDSYASIHERLSSLDSFPFSHGVVILARLREIGFVPGGRSSYSDLTNEHAAFLAQLGSRVCFQAPREVIEFAIDMSPDPVASDLRVEITRELLIKDTLQYSDFLKRPDSAEILEMLAARAPSILAGPAIYAGSTEGPRPYLTPALSMAAAASLEAFLESQDLADDHRARVMKAHACICASMATDAHRPSLQRDDAARSASKP